MTLGTAICLRDDRFSRRAGRRIAFEDALDKCGLLRDDAAALLVSFLHRFPPPLPQVPQPKLTPEQRAALEREGLALGSPESF